VRTSEQQRCKQELQDLRTRLEDARQMQTMSCADKDKELRRLNQEMETQKKKLAGSLDTRIRVVSNCAAIVIEHQEKISGMQEEVSRLVDGLYNVVE